MNKDEFARNFSAPAGAPLFGPPPYIYRGVQDMIIPYEAETQKVREMLPPGVEPADDPAVCIAWGRWIPFSSFGPYHEAYVMVRVIHDGVTYLYQPVILVDNEVGLAAGREIWGYAKKLAHFERGSGDNLGGYGEQLLFRVDRPKGQPVMTASMVRDRRADPADLGPELPILSCRIIPSSDGSRRPSVAELVRLDVTAHLHEGPDGNPEFYTGRAKLALEGGAADPWDKLAPTRILGGYYGVFDFDLGFGRVVHDYVKDDDVWT